MASIFFFHGPWGIFWFLVLSFFFFYVLWVEDLVLNHFFNLKKEEIEKG